MVKPKILDETRNDKFRRIAASRTQRILDDLRLLGNCSNTSVYEYSDEEISKIFNMVDKELKRVKGLFDKPKKEKFSF